MSLRQRESMVDRMAREIGQIDGQRIRLTSTTALSFRSLHRRHRVLVAMRKFCARVLTARVGLSR